jgi:hypothetical protein
VLHTAQIAQLFTSPYSDTLGVRLLFLAEATEDLLARGGHHLSRLHELGVLRRLLIQHLRERERERERG